MDFPQSSRISVNFFVMRFVEDSDRLRILLFFLINRNNIIQKCTELSIVILPIKMPMPKKPFFKALAFIHHVFKKACEFVIVRIRHKAHVKYYLFGRSMCNNVIYVVVVLFEVRNSFLIFSIIREFLIPVGISDAIVYGFVRSSQSSQSCSSAVSRNTKPKSPATMSTSSSPHVVSRIKLEFPLINLPIVRCISPVTLIILIPPLSFWMFHIYFFHFIPSIK